MKVIMKPAALAAWLPIASTHGGRVVGRSRRRGGGHFVVAEDRGKLVKPPIVGGQVHREGTAANIVSLGLVETDHDKE
jgi:hypothetical protein